MADGTTLPGTGVVVQDDDVTTVNGITVASSKVQRNKIDSAGVDGSHRDTGPLYPFPVGIYDSDLNLPSGNTTYREQIVGSRYTVLSDSIADGLASFWTQTVGNGGTISVVTGEGLLQTSAAANGSSQLVSTVPAYYPGQSHWNIASARFGDMGVAGNIRRIGSFTVNGAGVPQDGFAFELNGTTLNAVSYKGGVATATASSTWSKGAYVLDANYHLWEERWTGNRVDFYIDGIIRHTVTGIATPITNILNFPMAAQNINGTNATNVVLAVRNIGLGRVGEREAFSVSPDTTLQSAAAANGNGFLLPVSGFGTALVIVTGTFGATINWEATANGSDFFPISAVQTGTSLILPTATSAGNYRLAVVGMVSLRARISGFASGAVTVVGHASNAPHAGKVVSLAASGNIVGNVGLVSGTTTIGARPDGFLRAQIDPTTLLFDTFETLDTTNTWTLGGTALPTGASGVLTIAANATVSATSYASSKPAFTPGSNAYLQFAALTTIDGAATTGTSRFWGLGIINTPTVTVPVTNGSVFEVDTTGALLGSIYSGGARTQTLSLTKPSDGNVHRYAIYYKASRAYFEIDNVIVGSLPFPNPQVSALNVVIGQINSGTVTGTNTLTSTLLGVADTGRNATKLADGLYPWRTATFKPGVVSVAGDNALVVTMHPSSATQPVNTAQIAGTATATGTGISGAGVQRFTWATDVGLPTGANVIGALVANQSVNISQMGGVAVTMGSGIVGTGVQRVVLATDVALPTGANVIGALVANQSVNTAQIGGVATATGTGISGTGVQRITWATDIGLPTGANVIGALVANQSMNISQMGGVAVTMGSGVVGTGVQRVVLATDVPLPAPTLPTAFALTAAATTNATIVKASAGTVYGLTVTNIGAAVAFLRLYNTATAPTVGTTVSILTIPIPTNGVVTLNFGVLGHRFATGISIATTNLGTEADATAITAAQLKIIIDYI